MLQSETDVLLAQDTLQYAAPIIVSLYYMGTLGASFCTLQKGTKYPSHGSRRTTFGAVCFVLVTYLFQTGLLVPDSFAPAPRVSSISANVNAISSLLLWFVLTAVLLRTKRPVWYPYLGSWLITLACEITILGLFTSRHAIKTAVPIILVIIEACRILALLLLLATHTTSQLPTQRSRSDEESASLLKHKTARTSGRDTTTQPANGYGSVTVADGTHAASTDTEDSESESPADEESKKRRQALAERLKKDGNWFTYFKGFSVFIPMIWPSQQPKLYLNMVGCGLCILCDRFLKFLVPYQLGVIVNILTSGTGALYTAIGLYAVARWAASGSFGLDILRRWLWQPIERYSKTAITTAAYNQIMELSSDFHDNKRSGELYQAITQGSSVTELLEMVLFDLGPMLIDVVVGFVYLYYLFGPYMALLALATTCAYLVTATHFNARQSGVRRDYQDLSRKRYQVMYDTVGSWATVSYFNRIPYEKGNYKKAVTLYMATQQRYFRLSYLYNSISISTMDLGLCGALLLAAYQVKHGTHPVGDFVVLLSYWSIYTGPLGFFGHAHKRVLSDLVDAEKLLQLFQHERKIKDGPQTFVLKGGAVEFKDVQFSYDSSKQVVKCLNFVAQPGQNIALVGETGGGKSTLLKLIFRFYDVTVGSLSIDGQDVRDVTLESLRSHIGVVPQDPSMFNDTIMNNVRYSRLEATDEEVMEACKAAAVHDKILSFTEGYSTTVGEKGVKLSGGELQRLAIARAILKNPNIILLDEATSSVDTETESHIQSALHKLTKGRTTFTVAHRLSTIVDADVILVIKDGMIVEQGPPKVLLATKGKYYDLWCKQVGVTMTAARDDLEAAGGGTDSAAVDPPDKAKDESMAAKEDEQARPGSREQKSVWRPDAPDFVPRHLQGGDATGAQNSGAKFDGSNITRPGSIREERTKSKATSKQVLGQGKRQRAREHAAKSVAKASMDGAVDNAAEGSQQNVDQQNIDQQKVEMSAPESDGDPKRTCLTRARRRNMLKSEPKGSSVSGRDGPVDPNVASEDSDQGPAIERRRVSAPSCAPSSEGNKPTGHTHRARRKHWRFRHGTSSRPQTEAHDA